MHHYILSVFEHKSDLDNYSYTLNLQTRVTSFEIKKDEYAEKNTLSLSFFFFLLTLLRTLTADASESVKDIWATVGLS